MNGRAPWLHVLWASLRFESQLLVSSWVPWFVLIGFPVGALLLGAVRGDSPTTGSWFSALNVALILTVVPVVFAYQLASAGLSSSNTELERARGTDGFLVTSGRVAVAGTYGAILMFLVSITISGQLKLLTPAATVAPWAAILWLISMASAAIGSFAAGASTRLPVAGLPVALLLWVAWAWLATPLLGPAFLDPFLRVAGWDPVFETATIEALWPLLGYSGILMVLLGILSTVTAAALSRRIPLVAWLRSRPLQLAGVTVLIVAVVLGFSMRASHTRQQSLVSGTPLSNVLVVEWLPANRQLVATGSEGQVVITGPARPVTLGQESLPLVSWFVPPSAPYVPYIGKHGVAVPLARLQAGGEYEFDVVLPPGWSLHSCNGSGLPSTCVGTQAFTDWLIIARTGALLAMEEGLAVHSPNLALTHATYVENVTLLLEAMHTPAPEIVPVASLRPFWFSDHSVGSPTSFGEAVVRVRMAHYRAAQAGATFLLRQWGEAVEAGTAPAEQIPPWLLAIVDRAAFAFGVTPYDDTEPIRRTGVPSQSAVLHPFLPGPSDSENRGVFDEWWLATDALIGESELAATRLLLWLAESGGLTDPQISALPRNLLRE